MTGWPRFPTLFGTNRLRRCNTTLVSMPSHNKPPVTSKIPCGLADSPIHLDFMPIPLALWNGARSHGMINAPASRLLGFAQAEIQAKPEVWLERIPRADVVLFHDFLKRAASESREIACDYRFLPKNRSQFIWLRETSIALPAAARPWQTLSSYIDITDLKTLRAEMEIDPASQSRDKLVRTMFHEIKNRLQRLSMEIELAALEARLAPEVTRKFTDALQAVNQSLTAMHGQLLEKTDNLPHEPKLNRA